MADYVTLADISAVAKSAGDYLKAGVVDTLRKDSFFLDMMPFVPASSLKVQALRIKSLPAVQNRKINATYTHKVGEVEPLEEQGFLFGGKTVIDRVYDKVSPTLVTGDYASFQVDLFLKSLAYQYNYDLMMNTPAANADSIVGLWYRLKNELSGQMIDAGAPDISPNSATMSASGNLFLDKLNELIYALPEHSADALIMNDTVFLRVQSILRQLGLLTTSTDSFGRTVFEYQGAKLVDIGYKSDQSTRILGNAETSAGLNSGGALSSIYAVKFGPEYLTGWQLEDPQTIPHQDNALQRSVTVDWYTGIAITNPRSVARLYNIEAA